MVDLTSHPGAMRQAGTPGNRRIASAPRPRLLFRGITVAAGVALGAGIGEVALRASGFTSEVRRHFKPGIYASDPELGWVLQAGYRGVHYEYRYAASTSTNGQGFRGPEWSEERLQAGLRVLVLGDSCTFGLGVADDETYPSVLEELLRADGVDAAVFNTGVPGYDTAQELALLRRVGPIVRPHVVLVTWLANDAAVDWVDRNRRNVVHEGYLMDDVREYDAWRRRIDHRGIHASALYRHVLCSIKLAKYRLGHRRIDRATVRIGDEQLRFTQASLLGIRETAASLDATVVLVLFPQEEEVNDPAVSVSHHESMAAFADGHGIEVVRVPQQWRAAGPVRGRYLERDPVHLNPRGYRELAQAVAQARALRPPPRPDSEE